MRRVWNVDPRILNRNANWLFGQRNQDGRFYNSTSQPSTSAVPSEHGNAFILWVLSEMRPDGLNVDRQLGQVVKAAEDSMDPYLLALAAVSASNFERRDDANKLIKQLASKQHADGYVVARGGTITLSGGASMKVETTALAAMAWMKNASTRENARKALRWITTQRKPQGGFGSSQATALALRAMSQFQRASNKAVPYMGWAELFSRGNQIARQRIRSDQREPVMFVLSARDLSPGDQQLTLKASGPNGSVLRELSYTFHMRYNTERPAKTPEPSPVQLSTRLSKEKVRIGQSVELHATVKNTSADAQPMTVARIGLPGGLVADSKKLEVMRRDGLFDHFELDKQGLVLVWESIPGGDDEAKKTRTLKIPLEAKIAGQFTGAPSQCFLNYHREVFHWAPTLKVTVVK